jgi:hypothetical protein
MIKAQLGVAMERKISIDLKQDLQASAASQ